MKCILLSYFDVFGIPLSAVATGWVSLVTLLSELPNSASWLVRKYKRRQRGLHWIFLPHLSRKALSDVRQACFFRQIYEKWWDRWPNANSGLLSTLMTHTRGKFNTANACSQQGPSRASTVKTTRSNRSTIKVSRLQSSNTRYTISKCLISCVDASTVS